VLRETQGPGQNRAGASPGASDDKLRPRRAAAQDAPEAPANAQSRVPAGAWEAWRDSLAGEGAPEFAQSPKCVSERSVTACASTSARSSGATGSSGA
jgi:hypothetical protein